MDSPSPRVQEQCAAKVPSINDSQFTNSPNAMKAIVSIGYSAERAISDVHRFQKDVDNGHLSNGGYNNGGSSFESGNTGVERQFPDREHFMRSVVHLLEILLRPCLEQYEKGLHGIFEEEAVGVLFGEDKVTVRGLIEWAKGKVELLDAAVLSLRTTGTIREDVFRVEEGDFVPTASPRQILVQLLVRGKPFQDKLRDGDVRTVFADIHDVLALSGPCDRREVEMKKTKISDGTPRVMFVCQASVQTPYDIVVGASQEDWLNIPPIKSIRKAHRKHRLGAYIPMLRESIERIPKVEARVILPSNVKPERYQI